MIYDDDFYYGNDGDLDLNFLLPSEFVTCFDEERLPAYRQAIAEYAVVMPNHQLEIDESGSWNTCCDPALFFYNKGEGSLDKFWKILEAIEGQ
jgi:hypothetical protein